MHSLEWVSKTEAIALISMYHCKITSSMLIKVQYYANLHINVPATLILHAIHIQLLFNTLNNSKYQMSYVKKSNG